MDTKCTVDDPKKDGVVSAATLVIENINLLELKALSAHLSPSLASVLGYSSHKNALSTIHYNLEPGLYRAWGVIEAAIKELEEAAQ